MLHQFTSKHTGIIKQRLSTPRIDSMMTHKEDPLQGDAAGNDQTPTLVPMCDRKSNTEVSNFC